MAGVQAGVYREQVEPIDLAPTLAVMLGINKPTSATGRVLTEAIVPSSARRSRPAPQRRRVTRHRHIHEPASPHRRLT